MHDLQSSGDRAFPLMPVSKLGLQYPVPLANRFETNSLQIGVHHDADNLLKSYPGGPLQKLASFRGIRHQAIYFRRAQVFCVKFNDFAPLAIHVSKSLRNEFLARAQGVEGNVMTVDGKTETTIDPAVASHTFAVPAYHLVVPLEGVADNAKNQCDQSPCGLDKAHRTITFSFRTGAPGRFRWQCFVPCAAGFINGFGGPMQTIGYMDGFLNVV